MPELTPQQVRARGARVLFNTLIAWCPRTLAVVALLLAVTALGPKLTAAGDADALGGGGARSTPTGDLEITLRPRLKPSKGLTVYMDLTGSAANHVRALAIAPSALATGGVGSVRYLLLKDRRGLIETTADPVRGKWTLRRAVRGGHLRISYLADAQESDGFGTGLHVSDELVSGVGYTFLALPDIDAALSIRLRWRLDTIAAVKSASSLGLGDDVSVVAKPLDVAHAFFLAGSLRVHGNAARLVSVGPTGLDPDETLRFCKSTLRVARSLIAPSDRGPFTFFFLGQPGLGSVQRGAALYRSFAVWLDSQRALDPRLELLVAHEVVHRWIGRQLRFSRPDGSEARWFSEGFAVHFAREVLRRQGVMTGEDIESEISRDLRKQKRAFHAAAGKKVRGPVTDPYTRGALYAVLLQRQLADAGGAGVDAIVAELLSKARARGGALPESAWREAVVSALGPAAAGDLDRLVIRGYDPIELF